MLLQVRDRLVRRAALESERWIAPSQFLIKQYVRRGFPASRFTMLENGIAVERIRAFPRIKAEEGSAIRLSYIGSLAWQKGVHVLTEAVRPFSEGELLLKVYGDPMTFPDYSAQLQAVANPKNTFFKGRIPNSQIGEALATSDLVAVPSLWYENSPVVIQEAFAAGVPVIASRIGALCEKVQDGIDGILVAPGSVVAWREALRRVVEAPEQLTGLRQGVHQPLTVKQHTECVEELYRNAR
jgi:glycosyltransferase involved in cell wall biosynthesis